MLEKVALLTAITESKLTGKGGSGYPTGTKWQELFDKHHELLYMAINGSEGEPGTLKDGYILKNHLEDLMIGIERTYTIFPQIKTIYLYVRKDYFALYKQTIETLIQTKYVKIPLTVFEEPGGYLCGENTVLVNSIEGKRFEPRRKPPFLSTIGLFGKPTIVNNIETIYRISQIAKGTYDDKRFYSITGDISHPGVYEASNSITVANLLTETNNALPAHVCIQVGGGASGLVITQEEIGETKANRGTGAILIYDTKKTSFLDFVKEKCDFLIHENCGKCTPCREGIFRLSEMIAQNTFDDTKALEIAEVLAKTSFCGLGNGFGGALLSVLSRKDTLWPK